MIFEKVRGSEANGTHYQGTLRASVSDLYTVFGDPTYKGDIDDKTQYEWVLRFENVVATIYDYKEYSEIDTADILEFHIGGFDIRAVNEVRRVFNDLVI